MSCEYCGYDCAGEYAPTPEEIAARAAEIEAARVERESNRWRPAASFIEQLERELDRQMKVSMSGLEAALFGPRRIVMFGKAVPEELSAEDALRMLDAAEVRAP